MSFNISMENGIKSRKGEQAKFHKSIQLFREIIDLYTSHQKLPPRLELETNLPADSSHVEKEEIDLLEKALEKALQVRSGSKPSVKRSNIIIHPGTQNEQGTSTIAKLSTYKSLTKSKLLSKSIEQKQPNDPKIKCVKMTSNKLKAQPVHGEQTLPCGSKNQRIKDAQLCAKPLVTDISTNNIVTFSKTMKSETTCLFQQEDLLKWIDLKHRENRLWEKMIAFETKSSASSSMRDLFLARMKSTFPMRWPCGSPENIQGLVHRLILQGQDLPENNQIGSDLIRRTPGDNTTHDGSDDVQDSVLNIDRIKMRLKDIHKCAEQLKREWESWDRWRPEWGCLCSIGKESEWHQARPAPLPKTITYTTKRELTKLEALRMRVAMLQLEAFVEKIISDILSPHLSSVVCTTSNPSLLRDLYSVLGEGGERFPAIVLDSEPDS